MKTAKQLLVLGIIGAIISIILLIVIPFMRVSLIIIAIIPVLLFGIEWGIFFALLSYWFVITFILASIYYFFIHKETAEVARID